MKLTKGPFYFIGLERFQLARTAALVLLVFLWCSALLAEDPYDASAALRSATYQIKLRHFSEAQRLLQRALTKDPRSAEAYNLEGICQARMGQIQNARDSFERAITLDAKLAPAYVNLADLLLNARDETEAMKPFKAALAIDPLILTNPPDSYLHFNLLGLCLMDALNYNWDDGPQPRHF